ncbi:hypothetical protein GHK86_07670 [Acidimicrobiaceae bacterium USS-CC1]|uniref:Uncharacterized protein n=1 Tax=Acidiferrimicrobium australe TaxID=2664430 RepID=A0ABW9QSS3_9ACTN|nr:hypothetical protein [Acidiferrimicrobium australe]
MRSGPRCYWAVVDRWMIEDGMVPCPAVGQRWETGLEILLADAVEVDASARRTLRIGVDPLRPATPVYDVVGRLCPHPWQGWHLVDAGAVVFVGRDRGREFPHGATVRALSPLVVEPDHWADDLRVANPLGWRSWLVRRALGASALADPDMAGAVYVELGATD